MSSLKAYDGDDFTVVHSQSSSNTVYDDFKLHSNAPRTSTDTIIASSLRSRYPDHTLTVTPVSECNLLRFASAGQAQAVLDSTEDESMIWRGFQPPVRRLNGGPGYMTDYVRFAKYQYRWLNHDFLVYIVEGSDGPYSITINYILHRPEGHSKQNLNSAITDQLIATISKYNLGLREEILVFDQGRWQKNHELWKSVQDALWSDVILDEKMKRLLIQDVEGFFDERENYREFAVPWKVTLLSLQLYDHGCW